MLGWSGTKNGMSHRVWLPHQVQELIAEVRGDAVTGVAFTSAQGKLDAAMRRICVVLDAEKTTPHDLRRTHGTKITELGFGRDAMNRIQNHQDGGIANVYDRYRYAEENKTIMEAVARRIMSLVHRKTAENVVRVKFER
jgi:integrase